MAYGGEMTIRLQARRALALVLAAFVACPPAHALISLNEGRDRIFVTGTVSVSRDSNVFANADQKGDFLYSTTLSADYTRRNGWIGVNANAAVSSTRFGEIDGQDFDNPTLGLEFTKQTGRTTGSLTISASRESRADASVNVRSTSWIIPVGLNFKYPIVGAWTATGSLGYSQRKYLDEVAFASLTSYSASVDLIHILNTEREAVAGYRYRFSDTSRDTSSSDHNFSLGLNGKLLRGISGSARVGYQFRSVESPLRSDITYQSWTASVGASYALSKKANLSASVAKDFSITASDQIVDTTNASLDFKYAYNSRWAFMAGVGYGDTRFLGEGGRIILDQGPPLLYGPNRHDNYFEWHATLSYSHSEHFKAMLTYSWFKNWSTLSYADFIRSSWTLTASTRW
jgi:outer membrane receptor protein involved in Fe transport